MSEVLPNDDHSSKKSWISPKLSVSEPVLDILKELNCELKLLHGQSLCNCENVF